MLLLDLPEMESADWWLSRSIGSQVLGAAGELSRQVNILKPHVGSFLVEVQAA